MPLTVKTSGVGKGEVEDKGQMSSIRVASPLAVYIKAVKLDKLLFPTLTVRPEGGPTRSPVGGVGIAHQIREGDSRGVEGTPGQV